MRIVEIIAAFERLDAEMADHLPGEFKSDLWRERDRMARVHCTRLLAVARAGSRIIGEEVEDRHETCPACCRVIGQEDADDCSRCALRLAVRGEKGKANG